MVSKGKRVNQKNWHQRAEIEREGRESKSHSWLWFFLRGSSVACRTLSNGSRMSVPICPNIDWIFMMSKLMLEKEGKRTMRSFGVIS